MEKLSATVPLKIQLHSKLLKSTVPNAKLNSIGPLPWPRSSAGEAIICGSSEKARLLIGAAADRTQRTAPPTRAVRILALEVSGKDESVARQRIANDLKTTNPSIIDRTFTEYRRHLINKGNPSGLYVITEDRRLRTIPLLSRIIRGWGRNC